MAKRDPGKAPTDYRKGVRARRPAPWNKGVSVGQKKAFSPADVQRLRTGIQRRGGRSSLRDLALFNLAIDAMASVPDVLALRVRHVRQRNGRIRRTVSIPTASDSVRECILTPATMEALQAWLEVADRKPDDPIFPGRTDIGLTARQMTRLLKEWCEAGGLDPAPYGCESLRRTKAIYIFNKTGDIDAVRVLLGHQKLESTVRFLDVTRSRADALAIAEKYPL